VTVAFAELDTDVDDVGTGSCPGLVGISTDALSVKVTEDVDTVLVVEGTSMSVEVVWSVITWTF